MIFLQQWQGACIENGICGSFFDATVPGNIQDDYGRANHFGDINFGDNCKKYEPLEDCAWLYRTQLCYHKNPGERVFFVTKGIDYEYEVRLNSKPILHHTGMFSSVEADITEELEHGNLLEIYIAPHPKRKGATPDRTQADQSCKSPVGYGWDWHPRLLVSGLWNDTYIETRNDQSIISCDVSYTLQEDLTCAEVHFEVTYACDVTCELYDPDGMLLYRGSDRDIRLQDIRLWWCVGQGEPNLYTWKVFSQGDEKTGKIGFKRVKLVMNAGAWEQPVEFPKTRSFPPMTIELNGRRLFAKGSNWVNPELFPGRLNEDIYTKQLTLAKEAHMNILRIWGGSVINKDVFYELCDKMGIMVWQEFPLACNNYIGTDEYLAVLEQEATAIIKRLRNHPCLVLWCGGNELFNNWSGMTDQSYASRLLNKLCYELDRKTPFIMTAPLMGMGHGHYLFYDPSTKKTIYDLFSHAGCTAYSEFGIAAIAEPEILKEIIPQDLLNSPKPDSAWQTHNGYGAWEVAGPDSWLCFDIIDTIFGKQTSMEDYIEKSIWMQSEGLKWIFEEARRQKPACSMALNWCFNEPWNNAAGQSLIAYPCRPKKAYFSVQEALRNVMPSAAIRSLQYQSGSLLSAELWFFNDSTEDVHDTVSVYLEINGQKQHIFDWETGTVAANTNKKGHVIQTLLPETDLQKEFYLVLEASCGVSRYRLLLEPVKNSLSSGHALNV